MKYIGCLNEFSFEILNMNETIDLLTSKGIFEYKHIASGNTSTIKDGILHLTINDETIILEPCENLVIEFYDFITKNVFKNYILKQRFEFFHHFNNYIFGLEYLEQKKFALLNFNKIYQDVHIEAIIPFNQSVSKNGIIHTQNYGKLQMLYYQLNSFKRNLIDKIKVNNYLIGNTEFYTEDNLLEHYDIEVELQFEIWTQILVELNDRFQFEEDNHFTKINTDKRKFEEYNTIFKNLLSFQFTDSTIRSFTKDHKAHIESLYEVLLKEELIKDHKENFIDFVKVEYEIPISKIISYDRNQNYSHDERVALFFKEWAKLAPNKDQ